MIGPMLKRLIAPIAIAVLVAVFGASACRYTGRPAGAATEADARAFLQDT
jgi:hypothetical protein